MINSFDTEAEAIAYKQGLIDSGVYTEESIIIYDEKPEFAGIKRYSVNLT